MHTDNYGRDYPDEKFVEGIPSLDYAAMQRIANAINRELGDHAPRFYQVVPDDYQLQPGFEP